MERTASYDDDVYAWSQEQAAVLRRLARVRRDLPDELDLDHIAEEIEDVGKTELHRVESVLELVLQHLLKLASVPDGRPARHWMQEVELHHRALLDEFRRSMSPSIKLDRIWKAAKVRADAALDQHGDASMTPLPDTCPFSLDELSADTFDRDDAVDRLRAFRLPPVREFGGPTLDLNQGCAALHRRRVATPPSGRERSIDFDLKSAIGARRHG